MTVYTPDFVYSSQFSHSVLFGFGIMWSP